MHTIPSEIILAISEHLRPVSSHRSTLLSLCLVDKRTYRLVKVQLYRHVELNSQGAITKFYQTLTSICPHNAIYVVALNVYPLKWDPNICSSDHARKDLVPQLRFILDSVPNLKHLHLSITRKALVLLLADLKPIFKLHTMAHSGDMSKPLLKFLGNQPTIVNHSWYGLSSWKMCRVLRENMNKNQRFLGSLQHATGPANFLAALMLCRPLTSITILIHTWRDESSVGDNECTGPGETMGWTKHMYGAYKGGLNLIPPRESLREIRIAETQLERVSSTVSTKNYMRSYVLFLLHRFNRIERLEIVSLQPLPRDASALTMHPWLLEMNEMSIWNRIAPSLKQMVIYGHTIPQVAHS